MAETETTSETKVSKVIANILKAAREQPKQPKPEEVAKVVRRIYPEKKATPDAKQARAGRIIENAKLVVAEAKTQGVHVSTGLHEWVGRNKLPVLDENPAQAFKIAKADLALAIKASDLSKDHWVTHAAARVKNAESAQALAIIALAPEEVRDNPNFIFQTAAQLAGSNLDPETQVTTKAFVAELKTLRGVDGFEMGDNALAQALTEGGIGAMPGPAPTPDVFDPASFASLPDEAKNVFQALNAQLRGKSEIEQYQIMASFSTQIEKIDLQGFTQAMHEDLNKILVQKSYLEARYAPVRGVIKRETFTDDLHDIKIEPFGTGNFETRVLSSEQVVEISRRPDDEGDSGIDKFVQSKMRHIFSSSREPRAADLQEQSEYWEIEQLYRYLFGQERAQAKLGELRSQWESEYRRNAIHWYIVRGGATNKEIITELLKGVPPDTMQHEQSILWGPEGIAAYEQVGFEMGMEKRFVLDEGRRWFEERPRSLGGKSRLEAFNAGLLTGRAKTTAEEWQQRIQFGSYITDKDAQFKESAFNNLANIHTRIDRDYQRTRLVDANFHVEYARASASMPGLTEEQFFYDLYESQAANRQIMEDLRREWTDFTLFDRPEDYIGEKLWNFDMLNKWQGCSPLQVRAMIKLESTLKANGITDIDNKGWKLARAIFAASRSEVGSLRSVGLARQLSNMPALVVAPGGFGVMNDAWQEQMGRVQDTEVFMRRFMLGGQNQGAEVWSNLIISRLEGIGVKLKSRDTFAPAQSGDESFGMRKARTLLLKSRTHFGMGFTEIPREPLATSMTLYDGTTWRFEPTLKKLDEVYGRVAAKRVGMGMRIALKSGESAEDLSVRREAWEFTAKRTPSKLVQLMFTEQTDQLLKDKHVIPGTLEWERFNRVMSVVEHNVQTIEANVMRDINLGNRRDFNRYFSDEVFAACGITDGAQITRLRNDYFDVVHGFQDTFLHNGPEGRLGPKYVDLWAHNKMALTASISDYDIKYTQWDKLPADHLFRRIVSDATGHHGVMEAEIAFMTRPEICVQPDMKKVLETEAALQGAANMYGSKKDAEKIMLTMDDAVVTYMESKAFYRWIRVVPGAKTILRQMAGIDTQKPWARVVARGVRPFLNIIANSPLFVRDSEERRVFREILNTPKIEDWPRKFAQLHLAPTIAAVGPDATTYDPLDVAKHYEEMEHAGLVTENHKLLHKMKDKHNTRFPGRFLSITQRYWWVPWVAAIAVGVIIASKEQGLDEHK